ncbi:glycosyltransferase family 4 protein [Salinimicrobium sp. TIG7-5_MAKvit]|uniref:glycosyltransferase family 4 protein n=1 Tax=Salinimicrobium sp. TIG7-5_MAKvit TaxID=3121289 RepID=UPI003C6DC968
MHIGFLTPEYPHPRSGPAAGLGTSIKNMATALVENGIKVSIFIYNQQEDDIFSENGIKFHFIKHRSFNMFGWYLHRKFLQNYLNKHIAVDRIDTIEAPDWTGITAFMKLRCPLVIRMNGTDAYFCKMENRKQKQKNFWFEKLALQGADHLLSVSNFTAEETRKIFKLKKEIKTIHNSIDVKRFFPQQEKMQTGSVLYFGSLIRKKGVLELPEIFNRIVEKMPAAKFRLAGKDVRDISAGRPTRKLMEKQLSPAAAKRVKWLGSLPYDAILEEIAKAQVVVLPSFAEALPMTWIEAMAMEKAVVTSDIGWAHEVMLDAETGFTVDPKDHELYAKKVLELLNDPALAQQMGKAARERVLEKFSSEVVVKENIKFYEAMVRRS